MKPNPYETPTSDLSLDISRQALAELVRRILAGKMHAFELDELLDSFLASRDKVVSFVVHEVWCCYDEFDNHLVRLNKPQWKYFQRLLLVLESDCEIESWVQREWSLRQLVAAIALAAFVLAAIKLGWGQHLLLLSIPFGVISIGLSFWQPRQSPNQYPLAPIIFPFASYGDLAAAYRSTNFRKMRYPNDMQLHQTNPYLSQGFGLIFACLIWLVLSPIPLLCQTFPFRHKETRVRFE